jgi:hypothetical protein
VTRAVEPDAMSFAFSTTCPLPAEMMLIPRGESSRDLMRTSVPCVQRTVCTSQSMFVDSDSRVRRKSRMRLDARPR